MTVYIALLRAVNLGSYNKVAMAELRAFVTGLGMKDAQTVVQSGNVVFRRDTAPTGRLETLLEAAAGNQLGLVTDFFVRTAREWREIIAANPFPAEAKSDPSHLVVMPLKKAPDAGALSALRGAISGREVVHTRGREAYFVYPDGIGPSKLTTALIERKLGTRGTARNWNTVLKLGALAEAGPSSKD